jgi:DNA-binding transcriptional MerR regulator
MAILDETPTFNLKAVIQETGLKPDTLRAWERRYGLPDPDRTEGGHRLYSQRDIDMLKWLIARQEEGLSISRAVDLWRKLAEEGHDPLHAPGYELDEGPPAPFVPQGETLNELRDAWIEACLAFDEQRAENVLAQSFALYSPETVCFEILQKGLKYIGEGWYRGEVTVQQEHFTSELTMRRLEALVAASPPPTRPERILVGCSPEEAHTFIPLLLTFLLKRRGWEVIYLGARVPPGQMQLTVNTMQPDLVILTAQQLHTAATLLETARLLHEENVPLAFGGLIFNLIPSLVERIPGHFLGEKLEEAPEVVQELLASPRPTPDFEEPSTDSQQTLAHYQERQPLLEAETWQSLQEHRIQPRHLQLANEELGQNIVAALTLGDIDYLTTDIEWVEGLLGNRKMPSRALRQYLKAYHHAAQTHLNAHGRPILEWLDRVLDSS